MKWEQAVRSLRELPESRDTILLNYFDNPLVESARRFARSEEWKAVRDLLPYQRGKVLDLGAGRGIACYAFAKDAWNVTATEPDPSPLVGIDAIRELSKSSGVLINLVQGNGNLPFADGTFDLVYARQVLHHVPDLGSVCREVARVLCPGGIFLVTREHVVSNESELAEFLANHPLHKYYGGENAFRLDDYVSAIESHLNLIKVLGPYDTPINYYPMTRTEWRAMCVSRLSRTTGWKVAEALTSRWCPLSSLLLRRLSSECSRECRIPGRMYGFLAQKNQ